MSPVKTEDDGYPLKDLEERADVIEFKLKRQATRFESTISDIKRDHQQEIEELKKFFESSIAEIKQSQDKAAAEATKARDEAMAVINKAMDDVVSRVKEIGSTDFLQTTGGNEQYLAKIKTELENHQRHIVADFQKEQDKCIGELKEAETRQTCVIMSMVEEMLTERLQTAFGHLHKMTRQGTSRVLEDLKATPARWPRSLQEAPGQLAPRGLLRLQGPSQPQAAAQDKNGHPASTKKHDGQSRSTMNATAETTSALQMATKKASSVQPPVETANETTSKKASMANPAMPSWNTGPTMKSTLTKRAGLPLKARKDGLEKKLPPSKKAAVTHRPQVTSSGSPTSKNDKTQQASTTGPASGVAASSSATLTNTETSKSVVPLATAPKVDKSPCETNCKSKTPKSDEDPTKTTTPKKDKKPGQTKPTTTTPEAAAAAIAATRDWCAGLGAAQKFDSRLPEASSFDGSASVATRPEESSRAACVGQEAATTATGGLEDKAAAKTPESSGSKGVFAYGGLLIPTDEAEDIFGDLSLVPEDLKRKERSSSDESWYPSQKEAKRLKGVQSPSGGEQRMEDLPPLFDDGVRSKMGSSC